MFVKVCSNMYLNVESQLLWQTLKKILLKLWY